MLVDEVTLVPASGPELVLSTTPSFDGGVRVGAVLDRAEIGAPGRTLDRQELLYRHGDQATPGLWGAREVRLSGTLIGADRGEVNTLAAQLTAALSVDSLDRVTVRYEPIDGLTLELACYADEQPVTSEALDGGRREFDVRLVADDPIAYVVGAPAEAGFGVASPTMVANTGDVEVWPEIELAGPSSGVCTAVTLTNSTTGMALELTGLSFDAGDTISIVTAPGREEISQDGVNLMAKRTVTSRFWGLRPGANGLQVAWTGGTGTATATWRPGWVGY